MNKSLFISLWCAILGFYLLDNAWVHTNLIWITGSISTYLLNAIDSGYAFNGSAVFRYDCKVNIGFRCSAYEFVYLATIPLLIFKPRNWRFVAFIFGLVIFCNALRITILAQLCPWVSRLAFDLNHKFIFAWLMKMLVASIWFYHFRWQTKYTYSKVIGTLFLLFLISTTEEYRFVLEKLIFNYLNINFLDMLLVVGFYQLLILGIGVLWFGFHWKQLIPCLIFGSSWVLSFGFFQAFETHIFYQLSEWIIKSFFSFIYLIINILLFWVLNRNQSKAK